MSHDASQRHQYSLKMVSQVRDIGILVLLVLVCVALWKRRMSSDALTGDVGTPSGAERTFVFIASSHCPGITMPGIEDMVAQIRDAERNRAARAGERFVAIGISLDLDLDEGMQLLRRFGEFDEVSIGRAWLNNGALRYIWSQFPGQAAVPQVVVLIRQVASDPAVAITDEQVLYRKVGGTALAEWAEALAGRAEPRP